MLRGLAPFPCPCRQIFCFSQYGRKWQKAGGEPGIEAQGDSDSTCLTRAHSSPSAPRRLCMLSWHHGLAWITGTSSFHIPCPVQPLWPLSSILPGQGMHPYDLIHKCMPTSCFICLYMGSFLLCGIICFNCRRLSTKLYQKISSFFLSLECPAITNEW